MPATSISSGVSTSFGSGAGYDYSLPAGLAMVPYAPAQGDGPPLLMYDELVSPSALQHASPTIGVSVDQSSSPSLAGLSGISLLRGLSALSPAELTRYVQANQGQIDQLLVSHPAPAAVAQIFAGLGSSAVTGFVDAMPRVIGNLDGVPAQARDVANRAWIPAEMSKLESEIRTGTGRVTVQDAQHRLHMLSEVMRALGTSKSNPERSLLSADPDGKGTAAIVIGNLATADYVTYMVPGMFFDVDGQINDWTDIASRMYDEQTSWLHTVGKVRPGQAAKTVAVVAWMGYQTPDLTNIGALDLAYQGRDNLASAIEAVQAARAGHEPYLTVLAHSYGSTAALMALTEYPIEIDALAVVGSPGSAAQSVSALHVRDHNVWVGSAAWDPVPNSAWFGSDPASPSYGAKKMAVDGGIDQITNELLAPSFGHNEYFGPGTESIRNMALIAINEGSLVTDGTSSDQVKTLALAK